MGKSNNLVKSSLALACLSLAACGGGGGGGGDSSTTATTSNSVDGIVQPASWNFDDGTMQGWMLAPGYEGLWHLSDVRSYSPSYSLGYNDQDPDNPTYNTGAAANSGAVISQELALGAAPVLNLQYFLANECAEGNTCEEFDILSVAASTDGGLTYTGLKTMATSSLGFSADTIDLVDYANQNVVLAIDFNTGDGEFNDYEGAYVDDIVVTDAVVAHTVRVDTASVATGEDGTTDSFNMMLNTAPAADVTITVSSDNTAEALVMGGDSPAAYTGSITLTFTTANWDEPQEVSVKGITDGVVDGDQLYNVVIAPAVSLDTLYNGVDAADIAAVNTDDVETLAQCDGAALAIGDDGSIEVPFGFYFGFQGESYDTVHVGSNGFLTFGGGDTDFGESVSDLLSQEPRIAPLWVDLDPSSGGTISCTNPTATSLTVSYAGVPEYGTANSNSFDITLNSDGSVVIEYGAMDALNGLAGISPGLSIDTDPGETDLSANPNQGASGVIYELFDADDNDLSGVTLTFTPAP